MTIDLSALPRHLQLTIGERIVIPLPSYANSGNYWSAICLDDKDIANVSVKLGDLQPLPSMLADGVSEPPAIMLVAEFAIVEGLAYGETAWRLVLARSFNQSNPTAQHDINIIVG